MINSILGIIGTVLLMIIGIWKYYGRKNAERRKLADEAGDKLKEAQKTGNKSDYLDAWDRAKRMH
jgi:hypothetical protein